MKSARQNRVRRFVARDTGQYINAVRFSSLLSLLSFVGLLIMAIHFVGYLHYASVGQRISITEAENEEDEGQTFCTLEVQATIPLLREVVYDDSMNQVLYVGPDIGSVIAELLTNEDDYEAWGVEPYDPDDTELSSWDLIDKGLVRVVDMKFPLPYRENSFSHVIISDTLEYMSSQYLNRTIPELMRVSRDGVIIFVARPDFPVTKFTKYRYNRQAKLRSPSWWKRYLVQRKFEEDEAGKRRFKKVLRDISYKPACQIFLLKSGPYALKL